MRTYISQEVKEIAVQEARINLLGCAIAYSRLLRKGIDIEGVVVEMKAYAKIYGEKFDIPVEGEMKKK
jgi:hypothetical protein